MKRSSLRVSPTLLSPVACCRLPTISVWSYIFCSQCSDVSRSQNLTCTGGLQVKVACCCTTETFVLLLKVYRSLSGVMYRLNWGSTHRALLGSTAAASAVCDKTNVLSPAVPALEQVTR